jgi:hypothetical protein
MMPGTRLLRLVRLWYSPSVVSNVFEPLIADWQREWIEASPTRRAWVVLRGAGAFARAALVCSPGVLFTAPPAAITRRVVARLIMLTAVTCVPFLIPYLFELRTLRIDVAIPLAMWIIPAAVAAALPFTLGFSTDGIRRRGTEPTRAERTMSAQLATFAVLGVIILQGWVVPAANQRYRAGMVKHEAFTTLSLSATGEPPRGIRELNTLELARELAATPSSGHPQGRDNVLARALYARVAFPVLTLVIMWLRWRALEAPGCRWREAVTTPIALVLTGVTYFTLGAAFDLVLGGGPIAGACGPIAVLLLFGWYRGRLRGPTLSTMAPTPSAP